MNDRLDVLEGAAPPPASLADAQAFLQQAFRSKQPVTDRKDLHDRVASIARPSAKLTAAGRVDVYREQFDIRHHGSLLEDFPTLVFLLGETAFRELFDRYVAAHPPRHFLLRNFSEDLPTFVATDERYASDSLLADCARVEWAFMEATDAANPRPFDASSLAGASEEALMSARLQMQAPLRLVATKHPVHEFREAVRAKTGPVRPEPRDTYLAIFRQGDGLHYFELERPAFEVVRALMNGEPLGDACARGVEAGMPEAELGTKLGQWFQTWTQWNWLERVVLA